jgi:hypothetical protein
VAVDPRGELFYIESNPLEKPRHSSAEVADKADTLKFLGTLRQKRHSARGLSNEVVRTTELLLQDCNMFVLFNMLLRSRLKHQFERIQCCFQGL